MHLSKSLYTRGVQCPKSLWLKKYNPNVLTPPDTSKKAIFENGNKIGKLAWELFPKGKEVPHDKTSFANMIDLTQEYIDKGVKDIYEATFSYQSIIIMVDILHINKDGSVEINEVKSSTEVKEINLHDAAIQFYVLNGLGYDVNRVNIIHVNNQYIRSKELDVNELLISVDISDEVKELQTTVPVYLNSFKEHLEDKNSEPNIEIGKQCKKPYVCDAFEYCWREQRNIPEYSIFDLFNIGSKKQKELYEKGIVKIDEVPIGFPLTDNQAKAVDIHKANETYIDKEAINEFLETLSYPIYHLDFETFQQVIPEWKGVKPYMQIPFQYSLHIQHSDGTLEHKEFLAKEGEDPRYGLARKLVNDIPKYVTVLAYNMHFEKNVIKNLAADFPDLSFKLMAIHDNIKDLMTPFYYKHYCTPSMNGSYSIKKVLPALVPEMKEAYEKLDIVHHGAEAMQIYAELPKMNPVERQKSRVALLEYCKLDTLAMVKILQKLEEI